MPASGMDGDCGWHNPMLAIPVDASSQAPYRSFPYRHGKSLTSLLLLFPKSRQTFWEPCMAGQFFLCSRLLPYLSLPAEKKILCFSTSVLDMISSFDFRHTKKPPHGITNGRGISLLSKIVMLCNGFEIQNPCCIHLPKKQLTFGGGQFLSIGWLPIGLLMWFSIFKSLNRVEN